MRKIANVLLLFVLVSTIAFGVAQLSSTHAAKACPTGIGGCPNNIDPVFSKGCCYLNPCVADLNGVDLGAISTRFSAYGRCPLVGEPI